MTIHFIQVQEINFGGNFKLTSFGRRVECAHNSTYKKLAVQWLYDPDSYRDCATYQV